MRPCHPLGFPDTKGEMARNNYGNSIYELWKQNNALAIRIFLFMRANCEFASGISYESCYFKEKYFLVASSVASVALYPN